MEIEEELFVNFSVRSFLEGQEADVQQFTHQLENLQLADEKVSTMEGQLASLGQALVEENTWQSWSDIDGVLMNLEDQLFAQVYDLTFHPNRDTDMMRDQ
ncbi:MAG: hypothetical protein MJE68_09020 [Proteobacteria bacterium]|nr:hypothetical protein [Pseudomonadota bacterium]